MIIAIFPASNTGQFIVFRCHTDNAANKTQPVARERLSFCDLAGDGFFVHSNLQHAFEATRRAENWREIDVFSDETSQRPCIERSEPKVSIPLGC